MLFGLPFGKNAFISFPHIILFGENTETVLPFLEDILMYVTLRKHFKFHIIYSGLVRQFIPNPFCSFILLPFIGPQNVLAYFKTSEKDMLNSKFNSQSFYIYFKMVMCLPNLSSC